MRVTIDEMLRNLAELDETELERVLFYLDEFNRMSDADRRELLTVRASDTIGECDRCRHMSVVSTARDWNECAKGHGCSAA